MEKCKDYPLFEPNQVLSAEQLNQLAEYLESQDRLTRNKLIGIGILCGLEVTVISGMKIKISNGSGITTEGFLITFDESETEFTRYRQYTDPAKYSLFKIDGFEINLWELLPAVVEEEDNTIFDLTEDFLKTKGVILYLERMEVDLETCVGDDCDDKGKTIEFCVKKLLIEKNDLIKITNECSSNGNSEEEKHAKFELPEVLIGRHINIFNQSNSFEEIYNFYGELILKTKLEDVQKALKLCYSTYVPILKVKYDDNPFGDNDLMVLYNKVDQERQTVIQYFYDFLKDVILAYNEFKDAAFDLIAACCVDNTCFPQHLMLGEAIKIDDCKPTTLRHTFIPTPIHNGQNLLLQKVVILFERMVFLVRDFQVPDSRDENTKIKITPSKEKGTALSMRAIPYYFLGRGPYTLHKYWNFELTRKCMHFYNQSYNANKYEKEIQSVINPLQYNIDDYSFLRIEGHIEKDGDAVFKDLHGIIQKFNLPVQIIKLHLEKELVDDDVTLYCRFEDLELMYTSLRNDYLCFLESETIFFSLLDYKKKGKKVEKIDGRITGVVKDATGTVIPGAIVAIAPATGFKATVGAEKTTVTDKDGNFNFKAPEGTYAFSVKHPNYKTNTAKMSVAEKKQSNIEIKMAPATKLAVETALEETTMLEASSKGLTRTTTKSMPYERGEFFDDVIPVEKLQNDSPGTVYLKYNSSLIRGDLYGFISKFLEDNPDITSLVDNIYYPALIIDRIDDLVTVIPAKITRFKSETVTGKNDSLVRTAQEFKNYILKNLGDSKYIPTGKEDEILEHLEILIRSCDNKRFNDLIEVYKKRVREVQKLTLFSEFSKKHPGLEHKAGVPVGGTFIIVCDAESRVVADFSLPYVCCSDCPPITFVIPTKVLFKLPKTDFCREDDKNYPFILEPSGGVVNGKGVNGPDEIGGYSFNPSKTDDTGTVKLTYLVNLNEYELFVNVIEINTNIAYVFDLPDSENRRRSVSFTAIPDDADIYEWDFGDGNTSEESNPKHTFNISEVNEFEVTLVVKKGECTGTKKQQITIPSCTADFTYKIIEMKNNTAFIQFASEMPEDETTSYEWKFDDFGSSNEANPMKSFDVREKQLFDISLSVTKGDCRDDTTQTITITTCTARFEHKEPAVTGNIGKVEFQADMHDAEIYDWDFGDGSSSINRSSLIHNYILGRVEKNITVTLTVKKNICSNNWVETFTIPAAQEMSVEIEGDEFCRSDPDEYIFKRSSEEIKINERFGVVMKDDKNFYFFPSKITDEEMQETSGKITFTYTLPGGQRSNLTVNVYDPKPVFKVGKLTRTNPQANPNTYTVPFTNHSTGANRFAWRFADQLFSDKEVPMLTIAEAKAGKVFKVNLTAMNSKCGNTSSSVNITIPNPTEERERITIPVPGGTGGGGTVVAYTGEEVKIISDPAVGSFHLNVDLLNNLNRLSLFEKALGNNNAAYKSTHDYMDSVLKELSEKTTIRPYLEGEKDTEIATNVSRLFKQTNSRISKLLQSQQATESQYVYSSLMLIQISALLNMIGLQKGDLKEQSPLVSTFKGLVEILTSIKRLELDINQGKQLTAILGAALESAVEKPLYRALIQELSKVI